MTTKYITTAKAWNTLAAPIKAWNKLHPDAQKHLPPIAHVRARGWMITISVEKHSKEEVDGILSILPTASVYSEEVAPTTGYRHYQAFAYWAGKIVGSRVRALFGDAHCEPAGKPAVACASYCTKDKSHVAGPWWVGRYLDVPGMAPTEAQTQRKSTFDDAHDKIAAGWFYNDFINDDHWRVWALRHRQAIADMISAHDDEAYGAHDRAVSVDYVFGPAGSGKTRGILDLYGRRTVFIADLGSSFPFDGYSGQSVLLLDDFRSNIRFSQLLRILDIYPLRVDVKNSHTWARWEKVVISANIALRDQYPSLTENRAPLLRRFAHGVVFEKPDPSTPLPYASRDDAMKGARNDGGPQGVPGYVPAWEASAKEAGSGAFYDADFDAAAGV
ncbi:hypothetical protein [Bifidobacterium aquikefiricola]|uniref:CRESS-DNA virus Rep endonuclease domain-containing protein n=1 Tax=Bifidobacterium aquikefiricola TaxID=3059038 RepID=A0AB39U743_9BIFI